MDLKVASRTLVLALAGGTCALSALAQWQWIDKDGRKVFSDRSPPADVQEKNILKRPGGSNRVLAAAAGGSAAASPAPATPVSATVAKAAVPKLAGKDAELEAKKKQAEEQEAAKKKVEEEKTAKSRAENCDRARRYLTTLKSGVRVATTNTMGEREVMDDARRAEESRRAQEVSNASCQ